MADPTTVVAEIINRLGERDFRPFTIVLSDGSREEVPSPDHCFVTRVLRRIEVEHDDGRVAFINPLHITKLEQHQKPAA
jgi:hypothetical protein